MADDKKKPAAPPPKNPSHTVIYLLIGMFVAAAIINRILAFIKFRSGVTYLTFWGSIVNFFANDVWPFVKVVAVIVVVLCSIGIVFAYRKLLYVNEKEHEIFGLKPESLEGGKEFMEKKNERWEKVIQHINSANSGDWRLAIIEADVMLEELLRSAGYHGDSIGEMLKGVEKSDFLTVEAAWDAHKVRNRIAHGGSEFLLNEREAKRVISLYEAVFKEFKVI